MDTKKILDYKDDIIKTLQGVVAINSVKGEAKPGMPYGEGCYNALKYMLDSAEEMGFKTYNDDGYAGHVQWGEGEEIVAILCHLDIVPVGDGWVHQPFGGEIDDGKIYGRGTADNKGPGVMALYSMKMMKDMGIVPKKRIRLIFGTDEESGMSDMEHYFKSQPLPEMGFTPDSGYPIYNREKGLMRLWFKRSLPDDISPIISLSSGVAFNVVPDKATVVIEEGSLSVDDVIAKAKELEIPIEMLITDGKMEITALGVSCHAAKPEEGVNAASKLLMLLCLVFEEDPTGGFLCMMNSLIGMENDGESIGAKISDEESGSLTLNFGMLEMNDAEIKAGIDIRYPVTVDSSIFITNIKDALSKWGAELDIAEEMLPLYIPADTPFLKQQQDAYKEITGEECELKSMGGGTYARTLKNRGVGFGGAIDGGGAHQTDEFIEIEGYFKHGEICTLAIYNLGCK